MLGKSITEIDAMPNSEYHQWRAFLTVRAAEAEKKRKEGT